MSSADLLSKMLRLRRGVERILLRRGLPRSADVAIALAVIRQRPDPSFRQRDIRRLADADANPLPARSGAERIPADQQRRESVWLVLFHHKVRRARGRLRARAVNITPQRYWGVYFQLFVPTLEKKNCWVGVMGIGAFPAGAAPIAMTETIW